MMNKQTKITNIKDLFKHDNENLQINELENQRPTNKGI